jgi:hypothetical protein
MRGDAVTLATLLFATKGEYSADNVEFMGWYSTTVLLICLPVFLTFLAYAGILFYEVAAKKELITSRPLSVSTASTKYAAGTDPANPTGTNYPPGSPQGHQPVDLGSNAGAQPQPYGATANPQSHFGGGANAPGSTLGSSGVPPQIGAGATELYLWEELFLFMVFHMVGLVFCIQPALTKRNHNSVGIVIAWLHFPYICGYAFVSVTPANSDQGNGQSQDVHAHRIPRIQLHPARQRPGLIIYCGGDSQLLISL